MRIINKMDISIKNLNLNNITKEKLYDLYVEQNCTVEQMCKILKCSSGNFFKLTKSLEIKKQEIYIHRVQEQMRKETNDVLTKKERHSYNLIFNDINNVIDDYANTIIDQVARQKYNIVVREQDYRLTDEGVVYLFYDINKELLYIGKANSFHYRYRQHIFSTRAGNNTDWCSYRFEYFKIIPIDNPVYRDMIETCLINILKPICNIQKTYINNKITSI